MLTFCFCSTRRPTLDIQDVTKDDQHDMAPPRFIEVQKGKISLGPVAPVAKPAFEAGGTKDKVRDCSVLLCFNLSACIKVFVEVVLGLRVLMVRLSRRYQQQQQQPNKTHMHTVQVNKLTFNWT